MLRRFASLCALACLLVAFAAPPAGAAHIVRPCGTLKVGAKKYRVRAQGVTCAFAKRWTNSYLRRRTHRSTYTCTRTRNGDIPFYCRRGPKSYFVIRA